MARAGVVEEEDGAREGEDVEGEGVPVVHCKGLALLRCKRPHQCSRQRSAELVLEVRCGL